MLAVRAMPEIVRVVSPGLGAKVPVQVPAPAFAGFATTNPAGSASLNEIPVAPAVALVFITVNVMVATPFSGMLATLKAFVTVGGPTTVTLALEVLPVPPSVEVTWTLLFLMPPVVPVTATENMQLEEETSDAPDRLTLPAPAFAVMVPPPQLPVMLGVAATTRPEGRVSVNATPLRVTFVFGLAMVKASVVLAPAAIWVGLKLLVICGAAATVRLAVAALPVPPLVELTVPVVFM